MTNKQQLFVGEYLIDFNATQAAIRAGYSEHTARAIASRLLTNVAISDAIAAALNARSDRTELTQDMVIAGLLAEATRTDDGASHGARVSAWSWLAKHLGMFIERHEHSGEITTAVRAMSDEELVAKARQLGNRLGIHANGDGE